MFHFHKWSQWSEPEFFILPGQVVDENGMADCGMRQKRTCRICGIVKQRRL